MPLNHQVLMVLSPQDMITSKYTMLNSITTIGTTLLVLVLALTVSILLPQIPVLVLQLSQASTSMMILYLEELDTSSHSDQSFTI